MTTYRVNPPDPAELEARRRYYEVVNRMTREDYVDFYWTLLNASIYLGLNKSLHDMQWC